MGLSSQFAAGQIALTGAAQLLSTPTKSVAGVVLKAMAGNAGKLYLGADNTVSSTNGYEMAAGESLALDLLNPGRVWVIGTAADRISWATVAP